MATSDSKQVVWRAVDKAFDRVVAVNQIGDLNIGFPGQYYDQESGLYYNINRDYDPSTGRYIQTDPIGVRGGLNTYLYAKSNPIFYTDELGLCVCASGQDIANAASDSVGSSEWNYKDSKKNFGPNTNKCNLYVEEKLKQSGSYVPDVSGFFYNAPTAGQWADPNFHIPGYKVIDSADYQPGDIIAIGGYDDDPNATGHVGIVVKEGETASHSSITDTIVSNDWGFKEDQDPTFRRCSCD